jgi:hypothetical protein
MSSGMVVSILIVNGTNYQETYRCQRIFEKKAARPAAVPLLLILNLALALALEGI